MYAIRHRAAATAAAAFLAAAPLAIGGAAYAREGGNEVVFTGDGLLGIACSAKPSTRSVTVPAESTLRVVNNTGRRAKLLLDGAARGEIGSGSSADVLFHRGPVELALEPDCVLAGESAVMVDVTPAASPAAALDGSGFGDNLTDETGGATTVAAEPLASIEPVSDSRPVGMLALIATVCVVGVSAGAIRAIIAQRATRTRAA